MDDLSVGTLGAVVLADARRLESSFASVDFFGQRGIPFSVGVNCFDGNRECTEDEVRAALDVEPRVPVALCDVRHRDSSKNLVLVLLEWVMTQALEAISSI